jgi:hypothetical protein
MFCRLAGLGLRTSTWGWLGAPLGEFVASAGRSGNTIEGDGMVWWLGCRLLLRAWILITRL